MANKTILINTSPTENPQFDGGNVTLPSDDSVIDINPINENNKALALAVNQLFWNVNQGGTGSESQQIANIKSAVGIDNNGKITYADGTLSKEVLDNRNNLTSFGNDVGRLHTEVDNVKQDVGKLTSRVGSVETSNVNLANEVAGTVAQVANIKGAVGIDDTGNLTPNVSNTLANKVEKNATDISGVTTAIGTKSDSATSNTVYGYVNAGKADVATNTQALIALGGGAMPTSSVASQIDEYYREHPATITDNSVNTSSIQDGAVTTDKLSDTSVTGQKLAANAVSTTTLSDGSVTTTKLANDSIVNEKIVNNTITEAKLDSTLQSLLNNLKSADYVRSRAYYYVNGANSSIENVGKIYCDVELVNYLSGYSEVFIQGSAPEAALLSTSNMFSLNLKDVGISLQDITAEENITYENSHMEIGEIVLYSATDDKYYSSTYVQTRYVQSGAEDDTNFYPMVNFAIDFGTSTGTYTIKDFRIKLCGNVLVAANPIPTQTT